MSRFLVTIRTTATYDIPIEAEDKPDAIGKVWDVFTSEIHPGVNNRSATATLPSGHEVQMRIDGDFTVINVSQGYYDADKEELVA
jgi:hypothetical protein